MVRDSGGGSREPPRELRLATAFVELAGESSDEHPADVLRGLTRRCVELLDATAAALMLADAHGTPRPAAASDERALRLTESEERYAEGPCQDCCRLAAPVTCPDLRPGAAGNHWPRFAAQAREQGLNSADAVPLRHDSRTLGALVLFRAAPGGLRGHDAALARALAEAAAIGILRGRAQRNTERLAEQLQRALDSRVIVEQAKGVLAERWGVPPDTAFTGLRTHARAQRARLADLARQVVDHTLVKPESLREGP
jgi:GAF domain-containing protein